MGNKNRSNFGSRVGIILASAGSAVGLGNIWRFPFEAGNHGGATFIIVYIICILLLGLPVMIAEFIIGRSALANTARAFQKLAPRTAWKWVGRIAVLTGCLILGYYAVVAGWTLEYTMQAVLNNFDGKQSEHFIQSFNTFSTNSWRPIIWLFVFLLGTHFIIVKGVEKGIERASKILMPALFILLVALVICSVSLPGSEKGVEFLFKPNLSKVNGNLILAAMGQAFFSLSLGMGCLCTYASYFGAKTNLTQTALSVGVIDTFVAILAGLMIFPAAFAVGIKPDAGPSLIFITLPNVFQQAFGSYPIIAYISSLLFYVLLALAALTSTISLHEVVTAYLHEEFNFSRGKAAKVVSFVCLTIGLFSSLSLGALKNITLGGLNLFEGLDFLTAKIMLPLVGMFTAIFVGWYLDKKISWSQLTNNNSIKAPLFKVVLFLLKFVAPLGIALIFIHELGLLNI